MLAACCAWSEYWFSDEVDEDSARRCLRFELEEVVVEEYKGDCVLADNEEEEELAAVAVGEGEALVISIALRFLSRCTEEDEEELRLLCLLPADDDCLTWRTELKDVPPVTPLAPTPAALGVDCAW